MKLGGKGMQWAGNAGPLGHTKDPNVCSNRIESHQNEVNK